MRPHRGGVRPHRGGDFVKKQKVQGGQQGKQVVCHKCKQVGHLGQDCRNCFTCGKPGHTRVMCPHGGQQSVTQQTQVVRPIPAQPIQQRGVQQQHRGRAYALVQPDLSATNSVVEGMMVVYNSWARILFDIGATHSFISSAFASSLGLHLVCLVGALCVTSPLVGVRAVGHDYRSWV